MLATSCGIGLFLAHIGLQQAEGIGLVTANGATIVELGGCPVKNRVPYYFVPSPEAVCVPGPDGKVTANLGPKSSNYGCKGKRMHSPTMHLGIWSAGLVIVLMYYEVKAAIMFGVVFATVIAWIPGSSVSYLSESGDIPGGAERFAYFRKVAELPNPGKTAGLLDFSFVYNGQAWVAFLTLIYLDFLGELDVFFKGGDSAWSWQEVPAAAWQERRSPANGGNAAGKPLFFGGARARALSSCIGVRCVIHRPTATLPFSPPRFEHQQNTTSQQTFKQHTINNNNRRHRHPLHDGAPDQ